MWRARVRGWRRTAIRFAVVTVPLSLAAVWLVTHHRPGWYAPPRLGEEDSQRARREAVAAFDSVGDQLVQGRAFDVVLLDQSVSEWIGVLPTLWPEVNDVWPRELRDVVVRFEPGIVRVGAHLEAARLQSIVNLDVELSVSHDGTSLSIRPARIRAGAFPLPFFALRWFVDSQESASSGKTRRLDAETFERLPVGEFLGGTQVRNRFVWPNGNRSFRIASVEIRRGELRLRIEPL